MLQCGTRAHNVAIAPREMSEGGAGRGLLVGVRGEGPIWARKRTSGKAYKLSDSTGSLTVRRKGRHQNQDLDSNDVFILDAGREIFVWVGSKASDAERRNAMPIRPARTSTRTTSPSTRRSTASHEGTPLTAEVWTSRSSRRRRVFSRSRCTRH